MSRLIYNVRVELNDAHVAALVGEESNKDTAAIQAHAQNLVVRLAEGGFMVPAAERKQIEKVIGPVQEPKDLVKAVESSHDRAGDNIVVKMEIDPVWIGELQEKAKVAGRDLNEILSDLMSQAMNMGLFYDMSTERTPVFFTEDQCKAVRRKLAIDRRQSITATRIARHFGWVDPEATAASNPFAEALVGAEA